MAIAVKFEPVSNGRRCSGCWLSVSYCECEKEIQIRLENPMGDYEKENLEGKKHYMVSALSRHSGEFSERTKYKTHAEAVSVAKGIISKRHQNGDKTIGFYILEVKTYVGPVEPKLQVKTLK